MQWSVVIPVKRLAVAKSRLAGSVQPGLALAFASDTVAAAMSTPAVRRVIVVTDDDAVRAAVSELGAVVCPDADPGGLNGAIRRGAAQAVAMGGAHPVAALPSDLPALTPDQLQAALAAADAHPRALVPDAAGTGTTLLTARRKALDPRYGADSAAEHTRAGAVRLDGHWPGLRRDVDTAADLLAARALGVGHATQGILAAGSPLCGTAR